jgi:hypothetical protein
MMEVCSKCGKEIEMEDKFEKTHYIFGNRFYCDECLKIIEKELYG